MGVGFYRERILPRCIDLMLGNKEFAKVRRMATDGLHGDVLEIGFGSGLNLPHLPREVTSVWTVDPSPGAMRLAAKRIVASNIPVRTGGLDGARLELPDERFDAALSTMTLCTIPDVVTALREVRRVLKPGSALHFAEHGLAPDAKVARRQDRFNGLQNRIAGGCNLNRDIPALLRAAGFELDELSNFYLDGPKLLGYMSVGKARKV